MDLFNEERWRKRQRVWMLRALGALMGVVALVAVLTLNLAAAHLLAWTVIAYVMLASWPTPKTPRAVVLRCGRRFE